MRSRMVEVGDVITAINGVAMLGCDTSIVANALQTLPACVTLRLVKYGYDLVPIVAQTQVRLFVDGSSSGGGQPPSMMLVSSRGLLLLVLPHPP